MINNQFAINFVSRRLRPLAERARALALEVNSIVELWDTQNLSSLMPNDPNEQFDDDRRVEGVLELTGEDINNFIVAFKEAQTFLDRPEIKGMINKFSVRQPEIN